MCHDMTGLATLAGSSLGIPPGLVEAQRASQLS